VIPELLYDESELPHWDAVLRLAAGCFGADIQRNENSGPVPQELNTRPGLALQVSNQVGLVKHLPMEDGRRPIERAGEEYAQLTQRIFGVAVV
jgi:hypothetical protein